MNHALPSQSVTSSSPELQGVLSNILAKLTEIMDRYRVQDAKFEQLFPMVPENKISLQNQQHKQEGMQNQLSEHSRQLNSISQTLATMQAAQSTPLPPPPPPLPISPRIYERSTRLTVLPTKTQFSHRKIRDDARSLKISPALLSQQAAPFNFRKFGSALHTTLKGMFPQFPLESLETRVRWDFKGNVYTQFYSSSWFQVQELLSYLSSTFTELPIVIEGWGSWKVVRNLPSPCVDKQQMVISGISQEHTPETVLDELLTANKALLTFITPGQEVFYGVRSLKRKKFGPSGSHEWVDSTSMGLWVNKSLVASLLAGTPLMFEYQPQPLLLYTSAKKFCTCCLEYSNHEA